MYVHIRNTVPIVLVSGRLIFSTSFSLCPGVRLGFHVGRIIPESLVEAVFPWFPRPRNQQSLKLRGEEAKILWELSDKPARGVTPTSTPFSPGLCVLVLATNHHKLVIDSQRILHPEKPAFWDIVVLLASTEFSVSHLFPCSIWPAASGWWGVWEDHQLIQCLPSAKQAPWSEALRCG